MFSTAFAQGVSTAPAASSASPMAVGSDFLSMGLPLIFMLAIYVLVVRPNNKRLNEQKKMVDTLKAGDEVVTTSGLMGIVSSIQENHIHLKVTDAMELLLQRQSIQHILPKGTIKLPATRNPKH